MNLVGHSELRQEPMFLSVCTEADHILLSSDFEWNNLPHVKHVLCFFLFQTAVLMSPPSCIFPLLRHLFMSHSSRASLGLYQES